MQEEIFDQIMSKFGFVSGASMALELGRSRKSASRWRKSGFPADIQLKLLELAPKRGVDLSLMDFRCNGSPMSCKAGR